MDWIYAEARAKEMIEEANRYDVDSMDIKKKDMRTFAKENGVKFDTLVKGWNQVKYKMSNK